MKEIIMHEDAKLKLKEGINNLAEAVLVTMGPEGKTVIINDTTGKPKITKDGVSVAKAITFHDSIKNIGATLIKEVSENTVREAGDGTTTAICLANDLINKGYSLLEAGVTFNTIKIHLDIFRKEVFSYLKEETVPIKEDYIEHVARIAANNDFKIGRVIDKAFGYSSNVQVELGGVADEVITVDGMELKTGYFDSAFINNGEKQSIEYENAKVLIVDGKLTGLVAVNKVLKHMDTTTPIIIIADDYTEQVVRILKDNYNRGALVVGLIKSPGYAEHRKNLRDDIALATGARPPSPKGIIVGNLETIKATKSKTVIRFKTNDDIKTKAKELETYMNTLTDDYDKELLLQRINNLNGNVSVIKVGGNSEIERKERFDRFEDAVLATKCAIEEGIIEGGGVCLMRLYLSDVLKENHFKKVLEAPYQTIRNNGYDLIVDTKEQMLRSGIVDPVKVLKVALRNAISVAKTILGTEVIVLSEYQWK